MASGNGLQIVLYLIHKMWNVNVIVAMICINETYYKTKYFIQLLSSFRYYYGLELLSL